MSRTVTVEPERLGGWLDRFARRHDGVTRTVVTDRAVTVHAHDGEHAGIAIPYEPFAAAPGEHEGLDADVVAQLVGHFARRRRVALLLVRLGGHSVGFAVDGAVERSRTGTRLVHGRHRAGGSSANRFRRRRDNQMRVALDAAADAAADVLVPELAHVDAVVLGGDRRALDQLRGDRRLAPLFERAQPWVLDVPEPRRSVLDDAAERVRHASITLPS